MTVTINGTTGVSGVAGSATVPALIGSDADSGYYINSANEPNASVNGTAVWSAASTFGFKNRLINGAMMIDQRNAGASVTAPVGTTAYVTDRFTIQASAASKFTGQQNAGSVTPPAGFINYLGLTSSSAYTPSASEFFICQQWIEGLNIADLGWGTANAQTVTVSFWVRSSLTGTFAGSLNNSDYSRSYPFTFSIGSANTWTQITKTITGDTSGTWLTTNGRGIGLHFNMGAGSSMQGTANAWNAGFYTSTAGAVNVVSTSGATFYITGVQLEKGSTATSFDYRPYTTEEQLCMRYYEKTIDGSTGVIYGVSAVAGTHRGTYPFKVRKRATPTVGYTTITSSVLSVSADWVCIQRTGDNAEIAGGTYSAEL